MTLEVDRNFTIDGNPNCENEEQNFKNAAILPQSCENIIIPIPFHTHAIMLSRVNKEKQVVLHLDSISIPQIFSPLLVWPSLQS